MDHYTRLASPQFKRFTIRLSGIEIELRARPAPVREQPSPAERTANRARAEAGIRTLRYMLESRRTLGR